MRIIYLSNCCSNRVRNDLEQVVQRIPHNPAQKYHKMVLEGFVKNFLTDVHAVSYLRISHRMTAQRFFDYGDEFDNGIFYHHLKTNNYPVIRVIGDFFRSIKCINNIVTNDSVIICDALRPTFSIASICAAKKNKVPCIGIVTDVPVIRAERCGLLKRIASKLAMSVMKRYDGYVFLTEQMNGLINKKCKPYTIVEGLADSNMSNISFANGEKEYPRVCMYAGSLKSIYGIPEMVEGFIEADVDGAELHIYGAGDYSHELKRICSENKRVKFFGVVSNDEIVHNEIMATLLVNPRPADGEYTKYSFPSKNMEYMASGTPLLGVQLSGIPQEYYKYMYSIPDCSVNGFRDAFKCYLGIADSELSKFGAKAREYVLREKNNVEMTKKIISLFSILANGSDYGEFGE